MIVVLCVGSSVSHGLAERADGIAKTDDCITCRRYDDRTRFWNEINLPVNTAGVRLAATVGDDNLPIV